MPDLLDFFIHMPKTAGSTMLRLIEAQYPEGTLLNLSTLKTYEAIEERIREGVPPETRLVAGHLHYGWAKRFQRPCRPFTVLRDPVDRFLSHYYYVMSQPSHYEHQKLLRGELTLEELARREGALQARFIAGYALEDEVADDRLIAEAKDGLERTMAVFGLMDRFDESLLLFNRALGWKVRGYVRVNVNKDRPAKTELSAAEMATIRAHSTIDQALYDFAGELFERRVAAQPPGFAGELAKLRRNVKLRDGVRSTLASIKRVLCRQ